jgi:hypothetical protein
MVRTDLRMANYAPPFLLVALIFAECMTAALAQDLISPKAQAEIAAGYKDFSDRVQAYVTLHKSVESTLPALKPTALPEMIAAHQQALARKIREARPKARRGAIFSEAAVTAFRLTIRNEFRGPHGEGARATIRQGEPLTEVHLHVNETYPDGVPFTTVPPTLLLKLPKLPEQVAYRIVGRDLILLDVEANLVVDRISEIIP